ncbi:MAG: hypothetical protein Ta2G_03730 [Termitinemataceae bacterium]|nr:MAG: hypothetical protein Ta2G_03730 [Termitinemataceae bacterium]
MKNLRFLICCLAALLIAALAISCAALNGESVRRTGLLRHWIPGTYEGEAFGYNGKIKLLVETGSSSILDIRILSQNEDPFIGGEALRTLIEQVLETDSVDIDAISGATITSEAFMQAVKEALLNASPAFY